MKTQRGFVLLLVILSLSVLAMLAFWLNRENGMRVARESVQSDVDRARYAAEAGLRALHAKHRAIGCDTLTGQSVSNSSFGSASYAASAPSASPVVLRSIGTYQGTTVSVSRPAPTDVLDAKDTYLVTGSETNHGNDEEMSIRSNQFYLVKYGDLPSTPQGKTIDRALVCLRVFLPFNIGSVTGKAFRVTQSWTDTEATWLKRNSSQNWSVAGGDFDSLELAADTASVTGWLMFDLTSTVRAWTLDGSMNHGLRFEFTESAFFPLLFTADGCSSWCPKLRLEYRS